MSERFRNRLGKDKDSLIARYLRVCRRAECSDELSFDPLSCDIADDCQQHGGIVFLVAAEAAGGSNRARLGLPGLDFGLGHSDEQYTKLLATDDESDEPDIADMIEYQNDRDP